MVCNVICMHTENLGVSKWHVLFCMESVLIQIGGGS